MDDDQASVKAYMALKDVIDGMKDDLDTVLHVARKKLLGEE